MKKTNQEEFESLLNRCFDELKKASTEKYEPEKAEKTAAMFLSAQIQLAAFIADIELKARHSKNEVERVEAARYYALKIGDTGGKKLTEMALAQMVAKDDEVVSAKRLWAESESELKKYVFIMNTLRDSHILFRGIGKSKSFWNE